jgi:competence protein ComEC
MDLVPSATDRRPAGRYPMAVVLMAVLSGIGISRYSHVAAEVWWSMTLVAWLVWLAATCRYAQRATIVFLLVAVATSAACWHSLCWNRFSGVDLGQFARMEREPVCVDAIACSSPQHMPAPAFNPLRAIPIQERSRLEIEVVALRDGRHWRKANGRATLLINGHLNGIHAGDQIRVFAKLARPSPAMNPGEFDFAVHARRDRKLCVLQTNYTQAVQLINKPNTWTFSAAIDRLRTGGNDQLWRQLSHEQSGLAAAIMLGSREQLGREWNEAFFQTGTVHLMAISGLHVGMLALGLVWLMRLLMIQERWAMLIVIAVCFLYVMVTGARPPAVRAFIIVLTLCSGRLLGRQTSAWNTLAMAGVIVLAINPSEMFRTGTQLSFLAVAALIWFANGVFLNREQTPLERLIAESRPWWHKCSRWCGVWIVRTCIASSVIWLVTLPLVMARFHLVPTVGLMLGPILWIPVAIALAFGFLLLTVGWLWQPLAAVFAWFCDTALWFIHSVVGWSHGTNLSHVWVAGPAQWWLMGFYGLLIVLLVLGHRRPQPRWCVAMVAAWVAIGFAAALPSEQQSDRLACTFISVGHGSCVLVELPDGRNMLYDAGRLGAPESAARSIASYLWHRGITHLDAVVISHADVDHYNALPELLERFDVGVAYVSPVMFEDDSASVELLQTSLDDAGVPIREVWIGDRLATEPGTDITVMHPPRTGVLGSDNANSIVLLIEHAGHRILLPGDLEDLGMTDLLAEPPIDCDIIAAPHHGSLRSNPPGFTQWCQPDWVVISGGIDRDVSAAATAYHEAGSRVLHCGRTGTIRCVIDAEGLTVDPMYASQD